LPVPNPDYKPGSKPSDYAPEKKKAGKRSKSKGEEK